MPPTRPPAPLASARKTRPWRMLSGILALVLVGHLWLLGGLSLQIPWGASPLADDAAPVAALTTRVLPVAQPQPSAPTPPTSPTIREKPPMAAPSATPPVEPATAAAEPTAETTAPPAPEVRPATPPAPPDDGQASSALATPEEASVLDRAQRFAFPPSIQLNYDVFGLVEGQKNVVGASIFWAHDASSYKAQLRVTKFLVTLRQWTSKGALGAAGLEPLRFGESGLRRSEVAAHFVREDGQIVFSANTPPAPLLPGTQDNLSVFLQLASIWAGEPNRYPPGSTISLQTVGPRQVETWTFTVSPEETITVPGGSMPAIKLTREFNGNYSTKVEVWLAPQLAYLPAQIRLTETNGNVLDMLWTESQSPLY